jgi:transposase
MLAGPDNQHHHWLATGRRFTLRLPPPFSSRLSRNSLEDFIDADNPVRAIDVFVDKLDLRDLEFMDVVPAKTGRPSYHPGALLKLYIYGYLVRVQSSRRLEREC